MFSQKEIMDQSGSLIQNFTHSGVFSVLPAVVSVYSFYPQQFPDFLSTL